MLIEEIDGAPAQTHVLALFLGEAGFIAGAMGMQATFPRQPATPYRPAPGATLRTASPVAAARPGTVSEDAPPEVSYDDLPAIGADPGTDSAEPAIDDPDDGRPDRPPQRAPGDS
jgi:hypothetical protein